VQTQRARVQEQDVPFRRVPEALSFALRLRRIMTTATMMMISTSPTMNRTPTITPTIHNGKLDFSFPSAFACWLL
jgi:hypothetical protein